MGKKNKQRNNPVVTTEKKPSFIDKLKFMQKNKKPDNKKQEQITNKIVSQTPINFSTSALTSNSQKKQIPSFFMKVQNLVMSNANLKIGSTKNQKSKQQNGNNQENNPKKVQYETWESQKVLQQNQKDIQEKQNEPIIEEKRLRFNFS